MVRRFFIFDAVATANDARGANAGVDGRR